MAEAARLFHAVVVVGAAITAPSCGGTVEEGGVDGTAQRDGQGGSSGAGIGGSATGGSLIGGGPNDSGRGGGAGTVDASGGYGNRDAMLDVSTSVDASFDAADGAYVSDANRVDSIPSCNGWQQCGAPGLPSCPAGEYCLQGCCTIITA